MKKRSNVSTTQRKNNFKKVKTYRKKPASNFKKLPATLTMHKPEVKTIDFLWSEDSSSDQFQILKFSNAGVFTCLNAPGEGAAFYQRIGRKIAMKSIRISYAFNPWQTAGDGPELLRVMIIYDRQTNGVMPTLEDVLNNKVASATSLPTGRLGMCYLNMTNSERFSILMDQCLAIPDQSNSPVENIYNSVTNGKQEMLQDRYIKLKGLETTYKASTVGDVGSIATGGLYLLLTSRNSQGQCNYALRGTARLRYLDV